MTTPQELLPCPFCGSEDVELQNTHTASFWVKCNQCEAEAHGQYVEGPMRDDKFIFSTYPQGPHEVRFDDLYLCLLYTSDAADE